MAFWEDALEAAMTTGEYSEDFEDVYAGLEDDHDVCSHGVGFDEECEECEFEEEDEEDARL